MNRARVHAVSAAATGLAMLVMPIGRQGGSFRRAITPVVVGGLATTTALGVSRRWGPTRAAAAVAAMTGLTGTVEAVGVRTGRPFGRYAYTRALRPQVAGVPAVVPAAWFAMAVPAREAARACLGRRETRLNRVVLGAFALTAWDTFLDPQMVGEGFWRWARPGRYRGIPATNFAGWFVTSLVAMAVLEVVLPADRPPATELVGEYAAMATLETIGFATFFADRQVAIVGGSAMLPLAVTALIRRR